MSENPTITYEEGRYVDKTLPPRGWWDAVLIRLKLRKPRVTMVMEWTPIRQPTAVGGFVRARVSYATTTPPLHVTVTDQP